MFCPNCKTEYRAGFSQCSDCGSALVDSLETADSVGADGSDGTESHNTRLPELLWTGSDKEAFARLTATLQDAKIFFRAGEQRTHLLYTSMWPSLEIWIRRADHDAGRRVLSELFGEDAPPVNPDLPGGGIESVKSGGVTQVRDAVASVMASLKAPAPDAFEEQEWNSAEDAAGVLEDFHPEEARVEVWSGVDTQMAENLRMCFRENGIGCVVSEEGERLRILVMPPQESRAKEIIREVIEATPPE